MMRSFESGARSMGKDVSKAKRLRELEMENGKLKRLIANAHLDIHALKSVFGIFDLLHKM